MAPNQQPAGSGAAAEQGSGITAAVRERASRLVQEVFERGLAAAVKARQSGAAPQPRPHQVDCVTSLLEGVFWDGSAEQPVNYLMQHSTGSGKSFTIAALAVALAGWGDCCGGQVATVLVLNDRLQLDKQLGECVEAFWAGNARPPGGLRRAESTAQLASFLAAPPGSPARPAVVLTTVQKLATLWRVGGGRGPKRAAAAGAAGGGGGAGGGLARIAVIADEAHRHHGHGTTDQIHQILAGAMGLGSGSGGGGGGGAGGGAAGGGAGGGGGPAKRPQARQQPRGVTYFGFTATPSPKALQLFGVATEVPADPWDVDGEEEGREGAEAGDDGGKAGAKAGTAAGRAAAGAAREGTEAKKRLVSGVQQKRPDTAKAGAAGGGGGAGSRGGAGVSEIEQLLLERQRSASTRGDRDEEGDGGTGGGTGGGFLRRAETALVYAPFHSYTMRNAVQDGFVLDVLRSYTAVTPRLQIAGLRGRGGDGDGGGGGGDGSDLLLGDGGDGGGGSGPSAEVAEEVLVEAASNSRDVVERKAAYVVERFVALWRAAAAAGFPSFRGMVVARSRQHVVWFVQALRRAVEAEPAFQELADAAAAADPQEAASSRAGPRVYGAFSGVVGLPEAEAAELRRQLGSGRTTTGRMGRGGTCGHESEKSSDEGDEEGEERPPRKRRRQGAGLRGGGLGAPGVSGSRGAVDGAGGGSSAPGSRGRGKKKGRSGGGGGGGGGGWDAALAHLDKGTGGGSPQRVGDRSTSGEEASGGEDSEGSGSWSGGGTSESGGDDGSGSGGSSSSGSESWSEEEVDGEEEEQSSDVVGNGSGGGSEDGKGGGREEDGERAGRSGAVGRGDAAVGGDGEDRSEDGGCSSGREEEEEAVVVRPLKRLRSGSCSGGQSGLRAREGAAAPDGGGRRPARCPSGEAPSGGLADVSRDDAGGLRRVGSGSVGGAGLNSLFGSISGGGDEASEGAGRLRSRRSVSAVHAAVQRQASRLTVSSSRVPADVAVPSGVAPPAAAAAMEQDVDTTAAAATPTPTAKRISRRMTRAMSSTAIDCHDNDGDAGGGGGGSGPAVAAATAAAGAAASSGGSAASVAVSEADVNGRGADPRTARLLVVCSKYETGYDDPRLGAMFIDRSLSGARAVQVLGRLNRPAPGLGKSAALLGVVDFVNSVGALREAFEEFYDVTTLHTGKHARQLRQERQMERALTRILETLQPAADRKAAAAAAAASGGGSSGGSSASASAGLLSLSVAEMAALAGCGGCSTGGGGGGGAVWMSPEARRALEADLAQYVALAAALRMEMPEMPAAFAAALLARLTADREARESAAAAMRKAAASAAAAAAGGGGTGEEEDGGAWLAAALPDVQVAVCELEETFSGAIYLGGVGAAPGEAGAGDGAGSSTGVVLRATSLPGALPGAAGLGGGGGADKGSGGAAARRPAPRLRGRPLPGSVRGGGGWSRQAGGGKGGRGRTKGDTAGGWQPSLDRKIRKERPLSEIIAAANAALDGRYTRQLASGFKEVCARLAAVNAAAAAAAAATTAAADAAAAAAPVAAAAAAAEDVYEVLSLLRRLSLWPVTVEQLRSTAVGKEVALLRKHACPQVASLAKTLVARWKTVAAAAAAAATPTGAAAGTTGGKDRRASTPAAGGAGGAAAAAGPGAAPLDDQLRAKARSMLAESLRNHVVAAARAAGRQAAPADLDAERLAVAAGSLEAAVYDAYGKDASSYKSRTRMLVVALKPADGVAAELLSGATDPRVLAVADSLALAPASVKAQALELERKRRQEMEAWEKLAGQGGGASTYKSAATVCPSCGGTGATVHNVLSGGTYAQERIQIQKFVCDHCGSTWRND